jgi:integrase
MKTKKQLKQNKKSKNSQKRKLNTIKSPTISYDGDYVYSYICSAGKKSKINLGRADSPDTEERIRSFISDCIVDKKAALEKWSPRRNKIKLNKESAATKQPISLAELIVECLADKEKLRDIEHYRRASQLLIDVLGANFPATEITKGKIIEVRTYFDKLPSPRTNQLPSRQYVNKITDYMKAIFRWGASERDFLPSTVWWEMKTVKSLKHGQGNRETETRENVLDEVIERTLPHLTPTLRAMVLVQRAIGCRPSEVCNMKAGDLDYSQVEKKGSVLYVLKKHKTIRYGKLKAIPIIAEDEFIYVRPYLEGKKPDDYVFSPKQHLQELRERAATKRKSKVTPSQLQRKTEKAKNPKEKINEYWLSRNYYHAISNAIKTANKKLPPDEQIPHWYPYNLRHSFVTEVFENTDGDIEVARACVGQKSIKTTRDYNHGDLNVAINYRKKHRSHLIATVKAMDTATVETKETESIEPTDRDKK